MCLGQRRVGSSSEPPQFRKGVGSQRLTEAQRGRRQAGGPASLLQPAGFPGRRASSGGAGRAGRGGVQTGAPALCLEVHKGPAAPPLCPWQLRERDARALSAATPRSGRETRREGGAARGGRRRRRHPQARSRTRPGRREVSARFGAAGVVGICSPLARGAPPLPVGRPGRPRPPHADFLPLLKLRLPSSSALRAESENKF